ncbi:MADF domain [Cinara cedri]|uniref:MADF domain n=1 Tax=Cinara cedri TaxID=506608 RepID=A0A5E4N2W9_9HEMI|nr:MADF domain [Cinara cedri]
MDENRTLQFIEAYKAAKLLRDANHTDYCNTIKINDALERVANEFNIGVSAVKIKIKNLRFYFPKERQKSLNRKSGSGADETNVSSRFAYAPHSFLLRIVRRLEEQRTVNKNTKIRRTPISLHLHK